MHTFCVSLYLNQSLILAPEGQVIYKNYSLSVEGVSSRKYSLDKESLVPVSVQGMRNFRCQIL